MSERGRRGWVRWSTAILVGWLVATGAQAQQTVVGTTDDSQGGFVVIEDAAPPPAAPKPVSLPAAPAPRGHSAGNASPYKPGSAAYEIPWAKPGSVSTTPAATSPTPHGTAVNATASVAKAPGTSTSPTATVAIPKPVTPLLPPAPHWNWTIKQGYSIQQQLTEMAKKSHWNVVWNYPKDIIAGANWTSHEDFPTAAEKIITILSANGALIHYHTFTGNNTFLVYGTGASTP